MNCTFLAASNDPLFKPAAPKNKKSRLSNLRKTISSKDDLPRIVACVETEKRSTSESRNIFSEMYAKNDLYQTLCTLCNRNERYLVAHYARQHPNHEVVISRPSPNMAKKLRLQTQLFEMQNKKITGICFFCEEIKNMARYNWAAHILSHTGEYIYSCATCNVSVKNKRDHVNCTADLVNIFDANTTDGSLNAFICSGCNYLQVSRARIVRHLIKEHGYHEVEESIQFEKVVLVPDLSPLTSLNVPIEYGFSVRFKCTICSEHSKNDKEFEAHFDGTHVKFRVYECICGEKVKTNNDSNLTGRIITAHLERHKSDLYRCMVCQDIFLTRRNIQDHLLNDHTEDQFKYQHIHREPNGTSLISETTITKIKCDVCDEEFHNGNFLQAIKHFSMKHDEENVHVAGIISRKIAHRHKIEMKHYGYVITF